MLRQDDELRPQGVAGSDEALTRGRVGFGILGPVRVYGGDGLPCSFGPVLTHLLAALLLRPNEIVDWRGLVDAVWDERPPKTARRQIQNGVSLVRQRLVAAGAPRQLIVAERTGFRICLADRQLDSYVFHDLVASAQSLAAAAQAAPAVDRLRAALRLWRGTALAGCTGRLLEAGAVRLDEKRVEAIELRIDLELQLGRHRALVGELTELVASHPLRERSVGQLMLALVASGRRAEALAVYRRLRTRLADELGIDPGVDLQALHTAILRNEVAYRNYLEA